MSDQYGTPEKVGTVSTEMLFECLEKCQPCVVKEMFTVPN